MFLLISGWYLVWKLFLSRFKLVRELLGGMNDNSPSAGDNKGKTKSKKIRKD